MSVGGAGRSRRPPRRHPANLAGPWGAVALVLAVAMGSAITIGTAGTGVPRWLGFTIGAAVAVLTVGGLPSIPTNTAVFAVLASGGFVLLRHAGDAGIDGRLVLVFLVAAIVTVVLTERVTASEEPVLGRARPAWRGVTTTITAVLALVAILAMLFAPLVAAAMHQDVRHGADGNRLSDPASRALLSFFDTMDTHARPRLSDRVVMTVEADRPSFWRGTTYDTFDGSVWSRTSSVPTGLIPEDGGWQAVIPAPEDPTPDNGISSRQTFTLHAPYADELFAAATPVRVRSDRPVAQLADGTLRVRDEDALGVGSSYTVESKVPDATAATLAAAPAGPIPRNVIAVDLAAPSASPRLRRLANAITAHAPTPYAKVQAITAWLGTHTKYSLDAPLPPGNSTDTVDWFVFHAKRGWCEQIASALTIMLRVEGVPARVATGFATGSSDPITGRYTVRERDAHAWTEVYFPGIGWQGFDPTSHVPLAGDPAPSRTFVGWLSDHFIAAVALLAAMAIVVVLGMLLWPRLVRRRTRVREARASWAASALQRLERIGRRNERPRRNGETPRAYAAALAAAMGEPELAAVGEAVDRHGYGPPAASLAAEQSRLDALLAAVAKRHRRLKFG